MKTTIILLSTILLLCLQGIKAQPVPGTDENIPHLVTFGADSETAWGDDDFLQIIFFSIPEDFKKPVFLRVYDPDCGGKIDEQKGAWNTRTRFTVYGGKGAASEKDAQKAIKDGKFDSGTVLASKTFANEARYDDQWYTFGPFNPNEGELLPEFGGYIFKMTVEGLSGDDGNLYRFFLSNQETDNHPVEGAFAYYFKYKFRMHDDINQVSHIYPYMDKKVISIKQSNFDWDNDGYIRIISVAKNGEMMKAGGDNNWVTSTHKISEEEKNTSLDIQMIKNKRTPIKSNNVVIYLENQYGELLPFYSVPLGGIPKYKYSIGVKPKK